VPEGVVRSRGLLLPPGTLDTIRIVAFDGKGPTQIETLDVA
jgi:hypothetical protein